MRLTEKWLCLWPGLARLWLRGDWSGLLAAIVFAVCLNVALISCFVWTDWLGFQLPSLTWPVIGIVWFVAAWRSYWNLPQLSSSEFDSSETEDLFLEAQTEYLCGHWIEVEALVRRILRINPEDVDAHLMLATLFRHTNRFDEAQQQLKTLQRQPGSNKWYLEIHREQQLLARLAQPAELEDDVVDDETEPASEGAIPPDFAKAA